jgi:hypothetical protein
VFFWLWPGSSLPAIFVPPGSSLPADYPAFLKTAVFQKGGAGEVKVCIAKNNKLCARCFPYRLDVRNCAGRWRICNLDIEPRTPSKWLKYLQKSGGEAKRKGAALSKNLFINAAVQFRMIEAVLFACIWN